MPSANTALHERALKRAVAHESVGLVWKRAGKADVVFSATKNPMNWRFDREDERVNRDDGHSTGCELTAVVSDAAGFLHAADMPDQSDTFIDAAGFSYRIGRRDYTPGHPKAVFHVPNVVKLP